MAAAPSPVPASGLVGLAVNGVALLVHPPSPVFDSCLGHIDPEGSYHYHLPPVCLLNKLQGQRFFQASWWHTGAWPARGPPSPLVGWAVDGWPIFGPYDADGSLVSEGQLDRCGGKALATGGYGYFVTPSGGPKCLVGLPGDVQRLSLVTPACGCPASGLASLYCADCPVAAPDAESCQSCDGKPFFMFPACPKLGPSFVAMARVWGVLYLLAFLPLMARGPLLWLWQTLTGRKVSVLLQICRQVDAEWRPSVPETPEEKSRPKLPRKSDIVVSALDLLLARWPRVLQPVTAAYRLFTARVMQAFRGACVVSLSRAIFMLLDPWHVPEALPGLLVGPLYGVVYPTLNVCFVQAAFLVSLRTGAMPRTPRLIQLQVIVNVLEYLVQLVADLLRGFSVNPAQNSWLMMCQVYFLSLGFTLSMAWFWVVAVVWRKAGDFSPYRRRQFRLEILLVSLTSPCKIFHSLFSLTALVSPASLGMDVFTLLFFRELFVFLEFSLLLAHTLVTVYHASLCSNGALAPVFRPRPPDSPRELRAAAPGAPNTSGAGQGP